MIATSLSARDNHEELCKRAERWLRGKRFGCRVATANPPNGDSIERPDAIGWARPGNACIVVECKTTNGDLKRERHKLHHTMGASMGHERWILTVPGVSMDACPDGHGFAVLRHDRVYVTREPVRVIPSGAARRHEIAILLRLLEDAHHEGSEDRTPSP